jgi:hypothetical protein
LSEPSESVPVPPVGAQGPQPLDAPPPGAYQAPGFPPGPAYTPYQSYGYPYPMMPVPPQQLPKGMAITGMVLGIVGLCTALLYVGGVVGIVGLVFSIIALRAVRRGQSGGKGMAIAGLVTSILAIIVNAIEIVLVVWVVHTVTNCSQYDPNQYPLTGNQSQYDSCVRQGLLGN